MPAETEIQELDRKLMNLANFLLVHNLPASTCQQRFAQLPEAHRTALRRLEPAKKRKCNSVNTQTSNVSDQKRRLQKFWFIQTAEPPSNLQFYLKSWTNRFDSYFEQAADPPTPDQFGLHASFVRIGRNEEACGVSTIRRRFDLHSFYDGAVLCGYHNGQRWRNGGSTRLAEKLERSPLIHGNLDEIKSTVERYLEYGHSLDLWANRLGGTGYFMVLPQTVAEGLYERRENREDIESLASQLILLGIRDIAANWDVIPLGHHVSARLREGVAAELSGNQEPPMSIQDTCTSAIENETGRAKQTSTTRKRLLPPGNENTGRLRDRTDNVTSSVSHNLPMSSAFMPQWGDTNTMASSVMESSSSEPSTMPQWGDTNTMASSIMAEPSTFSDPTWAFPFWGNPATIAYS